jgi:hypothetical protein
MWRRDRRSSRRLILFALAVCAMAAARGIRAAQQPPPQPAPHPVYPPVFLRESWRQTGPEHGVDQGILTNPNLELRLYDPSAREIPTYRQNPPTGSRPSDWGGPSCIQSAGFNQDPPPTTTPQGNPTDPPNLWTGVCQTPVAATLRDKNRYVDLTGLAKIRWVTRVSGFHVVRPIIKLADGTWLVGDHADGDRSSNSTLFLDSEFAITSVRWLQLDIARVVTRGVWAEKPDLSRVDEVGFADLLPGSGHGWGGFVNVARIEVYGTPLPR